MTTTEELRASARARRAEAVDLRALAFRMDRSHVHELTRLSGDATWVGPTATALQAQVGRSRIELERASDDLRRTALRLEVEALDLDRAAMRAQMLVPLAGLP